MRTLCGLGLLLAIVAASDARADGPALRAVPNVVDDELDPPDTRAANVRKDLAAVNAALKPHLQADPRYAALLKDSADAMKLTDRAARKARLEALSVQAAAIRADAMKKAGIDAKVMNARIAGLPIAPIGPLVAPPPPTPPGELSSVNVTSFPLPYNRKPADCANASWDFAGNKVIASAGATPGSQCDRGVRAGRSVRVTVPAETTRMKVSATASVHLDCAASAWGFYAASTSAWGIRVASTNGATIGTIAVPNSPPAPTKTVFAQQKRVHCMNVVPNPLVVDAGVYGGDIQPGDAGSEAVFDLPKSVWGTPIEVSLYIRTAAEQEGLGLSDATANITPKAAKIVFYK